MDKCIEILRSIKKDELDERTFYEQVLSALTVLEDYSLNPHDASKLKGVLEEIGCVRYDVWKKEKEEKGESVEDLTIGEGMEHADIGTAVSFVSQLLGSYKTASYGLSKMLDGGEKYGWVQTWLRNSAELRENEPEIESSQERFSEKIKGLAEIKKEEMDERTFYEEVLKVVVGLDGISLTPEIAQQLKEALEATGCVRYDAWKKEKEAKGESVEDLTIGEGMEHADIGTAVSFVSQLLGSYSTASYGLSKMLDGGEKYGWVQTWLRNSAELRENEPEIESSQERFSEKIKGLAEIKKEEMDERTFYEEVLKVVVGLDGTSLTPETAQQLKEALEAAGCVRYDAWKKEKEAKGESVEDLTIGEGMEQADIGTAVSFVSQLLGSYSTASYGLSKMLDGGEKYGWVQTWLRNSAELRENEPEIESSQERFSEKIKGLAEIKKEEMDERTFYEEVLKVVVGLDGTSLTPETAQQLKEALEAAGCVRYDAWKKEKEAKGEKVPNLSVGEGMKQADIGTAVNFVSQLLGSYDTASFGLPYMLDGGEDYGWVQTWLRNSANVREMDAVLSPGEKPVPPIKSEIVAANKDMAVTQNDILGTGKRLFDKLMAKIRGKNKDDRKDEI